MFFGRCVGEKTTHAHRHHTQTPAHRHEHAFTDKSCPVSCRNFSARHSSHMHRRRTTAAGHTWLQVATEVSHVRFPPPLRLPLPLAYSIAYILEACHRAAASACKTLHLPCLSTIFVAKAVPLPCVSTAFVTRQCLHLAVIRWGPARAAALARRSVQGRQGRGRDCHSLAFPSW